MQPPSHTTIEHLLEKHVIPLFSLPHGEIIWQGDSALDTQSFVYYFSIDNDSYLLVNESFHGAGDNALKSLLIGNAIAPHQKVVPIPPKEGMCTYVNLLNKNDITVPRLAGDFSAFRILG